MSATVGLNPAKHTPRPSVFSDQQIREVAGSDSEAIACWTRQVAEECGVRLRPRANDAFVKAVSRLSDGVVDLDPVEQLLVALGRARVITAYQRGLLQVHYLL